MESTYAYPTYRFNRNGGQCRVENEEEDRKLVGEWFDHPPTEASVAIAFDDPDDTDTMVEEEQSVESKRSKKKK